VAIGVLAVPHWMARERNEHRKERPYECGVIPTGTLTSVTRSFYLVAVFFLFSTEGACILQAVAFRELGWGGFLQISFFIGAAVGLFYLWKREN